MRSKLRFNVGLAVLLGASVFTAVCVAQIPQKRSAVQSLSETQKQELQRKSDRFRRLPNEQKDRLRRLHRQIDQQTDGENLRTTLKRYHAWLKTLPPGKRAELAAMSDQQRLAAIREMRTKENAALFQQSMNDRMSIEDSRIVFNFIREFIQSREQDYRDILDEKALLRLDRIKQNSPKMYPRALVLAIRHQRDNAEFPIPNQSDLKRLSAQLSDDAKSRINPVLQNPEAHAKLIRQWMTSALAAVARPPVTPQQLRSFFQQLPAEQRNELEGLPRDQLLRELRQRYMRKQRSQLNRRQSRD